jgi:hypothetical protein
MNNEEEHSPTFILIRQYLKEKYPEEWFSFENQNAPKRVKVTGSKGTVLQFYHKDVINGIMKPERSSEKDLDIQERIEELLFNYKDTSVIYMNFRTFVELRSTRPDFLARFSFITDRPTLEKGLYAILDNHIEIRIKKDLLFNTLWVPQTVKKEEPKKTIDNDFMKDSILVKYLSTNYPNETFDYDDFNGMIRCRGDKGTQLTFNWKDLLDDKIIVLKI